MRLENKIALIAGAGSGMGRATALLFAQEGARVGVIARDPHKGEETASRVIKEGGEAVSMAGDLTRRAEAEKAVEAVVSRWGGLNILYYGAGGFFRSEKEFAEVDANFWKQALSNTLDGMYNLAQAARPHLQGGGDTTSAGWRDWCPRNALRRACLGHPAAGVQRRRSREIIAERRGWALYPRRNQPVGTATGGTVLGINRQEMSLEEAFLTLADDKVKSLEAADGD